MYFFQNNFPIPCFYYLFSQRFFYLLHTLSQCHGWIHSAEFPGATVSFTPMRFEICPLITLRYHLMYAKVSLGSTQFAVFFFPEYQVNFFGYDRLVFICFYELLSYELLSYEMVSYSFFACGHYFAQYRFCKVCIFYILFLQN